MINSAVPVEPLWGPAEAARYLGKSRDWVYRAAIRGEVPSIRIGREVRFLKEDLAEWVRSLRPGRKARAQVSQEKK